MNTVSSISLINDFCLSNLSAPGPVQLLYIRVINNVSVLINWSHVAENQTNGVIRQYKVTVLHMGKVIYSEYLSSNVFSTIVNGLGNYTCQYIYNCYMICIYIAGQIRYTAEVKALNSRVGIPTYAMFYTVEGGMYVSIYLIYLNLLCSSSSS